MSDSPETESEIRDVSVQIDYKGLLIKTLIGFVVLLAILALVGQLCKEPITKFSQGYVNKLGWVGVFFGYLSIAAFLIPFPDDAFSAFGLVGGMTYSTVVLAGSMGSITGGVIGYYVGDSLKHTRWYTRLMIRYGKEVKGIIHQYGAIGLVVAALTPLPYSPATWVCGAAGMPFKQFFVISFYCRIIKTALYVWLIQVGVLSFI